MLKFEKKKSVAKRLTDEHDNAVPFNVHPFHLKGKTLSHSGLATTETQNLKSHTHQIKHVLWRHTVHITEGRETGGVSYAGSSYAGVNAIIMLTMLFLCEPYLATLSKALTVQ